MNLAPEVRQPRRWRSTWHTSPPAARACAAQEGSVLKITPFDVLAIFSAFYLASRLARHLFTRFLGREIPAKKGPAKKAQ